jgi:hypothetical protein
VRCVTFWRALACQLFHSDGWRVAVASITETTKAVLDNMLRDALPLIGLGVAVIVNAAWIGFLGYFVFRLVQEDGVSLLQSPARS